uniref:Uncharacterized protein n=1 Tax=viral metagenome TaxID=1070528 RepID=A0A6M3K3U1_9ZZZZ
MIGAKRQQWPRPVIDVHGPEDIEHAREVAEDIAAKDSTRSELLRDIRARHIDNFHLLQKTGIKEKMFDSMQEAALFVHERVTVAFSKLGVDPGLFYRTQKLISQTMHKAPTQSQINEFSKIAKQLDIAMVQAGVTMAGPDMNKPFNFTAFKFYAGVATGAIDSRELTREQARDKAQSELEDAKKHGIYWWKGAEIAYFITSPPLQIPGNYMVHETGSLVMPRSNLVVVGTNIPEGVVTLHGIGGMVH